MSLCPTIFHRYKAIRFEIQILDPERKEMEPLLKLHYENIAIHGLAHLLQFESPNTVIVTESNRRHKNLHIIIWIERVNCFVTVEMSPWNERRISITNCMRLFVHRGISADDKFIIISSVLSREPENDIEKSRFRPRNGSCENK